MYVASYSKQVQDMNHETGINQFHSLDFMKCVVHVHV
jgi:hypothetical protein